eukprot:3558880-Rhodomonas_salina.1
MFLSLTTGACPRGQYWSNCSDSHLGNCIPCTSTDTSTATYTTPGQFERNDCMFTCNPNHYYRRRAGQGGINKCVPCTPCPLGSRYLTACSQDVDLLGGSE